jgi:hypothetical protein
LSRRKKRVRLAADGDDVDFHALFLPRADFAEQFAGHVRIQTAAQTAIGRHDDIADALDGFARVQKRMTEFGVRFRDVADHLFHRLRVRARRFHQILRLADFRCRNHLERARHLAGVTHALDLGSDLSCACHVATSFVFLSFPRKRESSAFLSFLHQRQKQSRWIPAFAGMTSERLTSYRFS